MLDKDEIIERNYYLNKRRDARLKTRFNAAKHRYFIVSIVIGIIIIVSAYLLSDYAKVFQVTVDGNIYYSNTEIRKLSGVDKHSIYLFTLPSLVEGRIKNDPLISDVSVKLQENRVIAIKVIEKKLIGYIYENNSAYFLLEDNTRIPMDESNMKWISLVPLIEGYTEEQLSQILNGFNNLDDNLLAQMSEIHRYPFSYDENMLEVIMRDGNYVFVSSSGLELLNRYYSVVSGLGGIDNNLCIYLDEVTNSGYSSTCPWNQKTEEVNQNQEEA